MPPTFITAAARMKKGMASRMKESRAEVMFWEIVTSMRSPFGANAANAPNARLKAIGTPVRISTSPTVTRVAAVFSDPRTIPPRYRNAR